VEVSELVLVTDADVSEDVRRAETASLWANRARDLVNRPANDLTPATFAEYAANIAENTSALSAEALGPAEMRELGMGALLAVGVGSYNEPRLIVLRWEPPDAAGEDVVLGLVGKGFTFDSGGISLKPATHMEDMKGDMAGAAAVIGLMHALAARKARVNAVGAIGIVENMPDGSAQRPGDIVTTMPGQTIEIINTDAEGRLVLADVLWYAQQRFRPRFIVDLATLTGAIIVALGKEYAGLFVNDERLANDLLEASAETGEKLWRMPLDKAYDKMIESKNADIKNIGGRWAGACTAAAFIKFFVKDTPWAHIDLAGTAMDAPKSEISPSWGAGWGVRLLDRFVSDKYEKAEK
ncbi:MAG: leucyl aminopeptidase, partial [Burkholderiales bacterium]